MAARTGKAGEGNINREREGQRKGNSNQIEKGRGVMGEEAGMWMDKVNGMNDRVGIGEE